MKKRREKIMDMFFFARFFPSSSSFRFKKRSRRKRELQWMCACLNAITFYWSLFCNISSFFLLVCTHCWFSEPVFVSSSILFSISLKRAYSLTNMRENQAKPHTHKHILNPTWTTCKCQSKAFSHATKTHPKREAEEKKIYIKYEWFRNRPFAILAKHAVRIHTPRASEEWKTEREKKGKHVDMRLKSNMQPLR